MERDKNAKIFNETLIVLKERIDSITEDIRRNNDTTSNILSTLSGFNERIDKNRQATLHLTEISAHNIWDSIKLNTRMMRDTDNLDELARSCRRNKLNTHALYRLTGENLFKETKELDTHLYSVHLIDTDTLEMKFQVKVTNLNVWIVKVLAFNHFHDYDTAPKLMVYDGPNYIVTNRVINCTRNK